MAAAASAGDGIFSATYNGVSNSSSSRPGRSRSTIVLLICPVSRLESSMGVPVHWSRRQEGTCHASPVRQLGQCHPYFESSCPRQARKNTHSRARCAEGQPREGPGRLRQISRYCIHHSLCPRPRSPLLICLTRITGTYLPLHDARELARQHKVLDRLQPIFDFVPGAVTPPPAPRHVSKPKQPKKPAGGLLQQGHGVKRKRKGP